MGQRILLNPESVNPENAPEMTKGLSNEPVSASRSGGFSSLKKTLPKINQSTSAHFGFAVKTADKLPITVRSLI